MWECSYAKEPFDCRLMVLRLFRKLWIPVLGTALGALLFGGCYYLWNTCAAGGAQYTITSQYEVLYGYDPQTNLEYTYINSATWNAWVDTDLFRELIREALAQDDGTVTDEQLVSYVSAGLDSDIRMPSTTVTTPDRELTQRLNLAVQAAMEAFGESKLEIERLRAVDTGETEVVDSTPRTVQAGILGAVSGALFVFFIMFCRYCMEEAVWIPETFRFRFGIPVAGVIGIGEKELNKPDAANLNYLCDGRKRIAVTSMDPDIDLSEVAACLPRLSDSEYVCVPSIEKMPEAASLLRECDGILLAVEAGAGCGRRMEHFLENLRLQDCRVTAAILWNGDRKLLNAYYYTPFGRRDGEKHDTGAVGISGK